MWLALVIRTNIRANACARFPGFDRAFHRYGS
jgi:hypothetical protein